MNSNMGILRKPFIFMQRHKLAYEWDSGLTATSKGPDERAEEKCTLRQFKALQPCKAVKIDAGPPNPTN